jgi:hypothetical protein
MLWRIFGARWNKARGSGKGYITKGFLPYIPHQILFG